MKTTFHEERRALRQSRLLITTFFGPRTSEHDREARPRDLGEHDRGSLPHPCARGHPLSGNDHEHADVHVREPVSASAVANADAGAGGHLILAW